MLLLDPHVLAWNCESTARFRAVADIKASNLNLAYALFSSRFAKLLEVFFGSE